MFRFSFAALVLALILPVAASGQLTLSLHMDRDTLLLYEAINVTASIRNFSGRTVELTGEGRASWLRFVVTDEASGIIPAIAEPAVEDNLLIRPNETLSRKVNLLPLFALRSRGTYRVQAEVDYRGQRFLSAPVKFTIVNGREIWKQTAGLPAQPGEDDEYRQYTLLVRRSERHDLIYVGVEDEKSDLVFGMVPLGDYLPMGEPEAKIDREGHLHVLYRSGPRSFEYAHVDPSAKILQRAIYSDFLSRPQLVANAQGDVAVRGGEQTYPRPERVVTDAELNPAPQPAAKPKRKWWWPFGGGTRKSGSTKTNAPAANVAPREP